MPQSLNNAVPANDATWANLLSGRHLTVITVMAGGVLLYAMNLYFTAALLPSVVHDIGGQHLYAWITTGFVIAAILGSLFVSRLLAWGGAAAAYTVALALFALGVALAAIAPQIEILLLARVVQGLGGGVLAGLGYAVIRSALPQSLWARATGVISAMWGLGALFGPALGGLFAELGLWRWAYAVLAGAALVIMALARRGFRGTKGHGGAGPLPIASLVALLGAVVAISLSTILPMGTPTLVALGAGGLLLALFIAIECRASSTILPRLAWQSGNRLKWVYLTVAALSAGVMLENFIPLFAQQLAGLGPLLAGMLGAVLSLAWVVAQLYSVTLVQPHARSRSIRCGALLLVVGLALFGLLLQADATPMTVALWCLGLVIAGVGIGLAWPLLGVLAMSASTDPIEGGKAAAGVTTTQLMAFAITSALAGLWLSGQADPDQAARLVSLGIAALCVPGILTAFLATRKL